MIEIHSLATQQDPFLAKAADENAKSVTFNASSALSEYMSPRQLLESSLAGCLYITVMRILLNRKLPTENLKVGVELNALDDQSDFIVHIDFDRSISQQLKAEIMSEAYQKSYVKNVLTNSITIR